MTQSYLHAFYDRTLLEILNSLCSLCVLSVEWKPQVQDQQNFRSGKVVYPRSSRIKFNVETLRKLSGGKPPFLT
jgi:hypothetical protein